MSTLGELVDRLAIVTVKQWHVQEFVHEAAKQDPGVYAERSPEETQSIFQKLTALNVERVTLIRDIDECLAEAVGTGQVKVASSIKVI